MSLMIESMESRVLMTASGGAIESDLKAGALALKAAKSDLHAALAEAAVDVKGFKTDIKGLKLTATQKLALATLEKTEAIDAAKVTAGIGKTLASGIVRGLQLEADLKSLEAHPTKTAIQVKVAAALVKLEAVFSSTVISNAETEAATAVSTLDTELAAVGTAIPSTQTTVTTSESDLAGDLTTLSNDSTSISSALTALASDLS